MLVIINLLYPDSDNQYYNIDFEKRKEAMVKRVIAITEKRKEKNCTWGWKNVAAHLKK